MKKNYYIVGAGLLLLYLFLKNKKGKQPELKTASDGSSSVLTNGGIETVRSAVVETETPLLISPSIQQDINQGIYEGVFEGEQYERFVPGMKERNQGITVRYVAGMKKHYI